MRYLFEGDMVLGVRFVRHQSEHRNHDTGLSLEFI